MMKQVETECHKNAILKLQTVLLGVTGTGALVLRRGDVEAVAQGEGNVARVVVLRLSERHAVEIERAVTDAPVEEVVTR